MLIVFLLRESYSAGTGFSSVQYIDPNVRRPGSFTPLQRHIYLQSQIDTEIPLHIAGLSAIELQSPIQGMAVIYRDRKVLGPLPAHTDPCAG